ncbi:hypothetical protein LL037_01435 [Clostridium estertheticum]|uniref:Uncharacterized protein n=1 Tax=Clostridium estertheticum TaxID=238834 RepID=A0AA47I548_9CLOT|nr:hypothetical protein LL038_21015 [Clostridium estertheticum]WAG65928.1 hypothetical protein LL037_01435 [Clostridium estertheticum]
MKKITKFSWLKLLKYSKIEITATTKTIGKTEIEMESLTAV